MPKRPDKMPSVRGRGATAAGFRAVFRKLNELVEYVETLRPIPNPSELVTQTRIGTIQLPSGDEGAGRGLRQFILKPIDDSIDNAIQDDYLLAYRHQVLSDGTERTATTPTAIARDWLLRRTPFDGETFTIDGVSISYEYTSNTERVASFSGTTETQVIVPHYFEDCVIYAVEVFDPIFVTDEREEDFPRPVRLMEVSSRAWTLKNG